MTSNAARGIKRTLGVFALFWVVGWSVTAYMADRIITSSLAEIRRIDADTEGGSSFSRTYVYYQNMNEASDIFALCVRVGLFVPVVLLFLSPFAWFIYRGFKPKAKAE